MAEHPIIMENKQFQVNIQKPGQINTEPRKKSVVKNEAQVSDAKPTLAQKLSTYAFGEAVEDPGKYVWDSYLAPTGKRVANDIVEHFLLTLKNMFQRWIWNGKTLDNNGQWITDRASYSYISSGGSNGGAIKANIQMSPVKELTFETRADAQSVLNELKRTYREEQMVTVRDYYEVSGHPELCENGVSSVSGWKNLDKVEVCEQPEGGFYLKLPRPINLKQ